MRSISLFFRSVTKSLLLVSFLTAAVSSANAQDAAAGAAIFKQKCTACHAIGKVVVGPDLKGINDRRSEEWLLKWIKNAPALIASGDPDAKEAEKFSPAMMSAFPELTDDDIKGILAYVKAEETKPAAAAAGTEAGAAAEGGSGEISNFMIFGLIAVIIIAFIVIVVLNRVIRTLERVMLEKQGVVVEDEDAVSGDRLAGLKQLSKNKKFILFIVLLVVIALGSAGWMGMWETGVHTGYQPVQPIKFSHQLHAGLNKIDCQYCHTGAFTSKNASIPSLNVCMNCHNYVTASDKYDGKTSPEIQKIYHALDYNETTKQYGKNTKPVEWIRIHNLPDLAYFNHSQHVAVAGIECQKCHGPIQTMEEVYQYSPLTMKWCVNCHKETEVNHKDNPYYDRLIAAHDKLKKGEKVTAAVLGGLECSKCHY
ncbi:cytochrome c3 family protein [Daejeonella sp. JGW-45]|uniref:cytochrome c3 family protein n=1 Tax=Daejeonella sp. JGW-45 TaxID=3034148 RepID=UPI0023EC7941|nr:cytochrome c3 family protein [Daejeonella sp. JGW-45]